MKKEYFVIYFGEDGMSVSSYSKSELEKEIDIAQTSKSDLFVTDANIEYYIEGIYPIGKYMIIKGELIVPKKKEVVIKYEL